MFCSFVQVSQWYDVVVFTASLEVSSTAFTYIHTYMPHLCVSFTGTVIHDNQICGTYDCTHTYVHTYMLTYVCIMCIRMYICMCV